MIKVFYCHRAELTVHITRMIEDNYPYPRDRTHGCHQLGPVAQLIVRDFTSRHNGESIKMPCLGGNLISNHAREKRKCAAGLLHGPVIRMVIVVGGNRQLNPFTGNRVHAFFFGGITVPTTSKGMDMRIDRHQPGGWDFPANLQFQLTI